ncbi:MAG: FkbM family methyltransferase [bacterium]|nr:FkbM family methyltransferase [bacterium]
MVLGRIKYLQLAKIDPRNYYAFLKYIVKFKIRKKIDTCQFIVYLNSVKFKLILLNFGILRDLLEYLEFQRFIVRDAIIVDIGAYVGDYSLAMAALGAKKVLAFEPQKSVLKLFKLNLRLNPQLANKIELYPYAVSSKDNEEIEFYDTMYGISTIFQSWLAQHHKTEIHTFNIQVNKYYVKTISLNTILKLVEKIDVLKIDIEGAEYLIFKNLDEELFKKKVRLIVMELHNIDHRWLRAKILINYLTKLGFKTIKFEGFNNQTATIISLENSKFIS